MTIYRNTWYVAAGAAILTLVVLGVGFTLLVSPVRAEAAQTQQQIDNARATQQSLELKLQRLKADAAKLGDYQIEMAKAQEALPESAAQPELTRTIEKLRVDSNVSVARVSWGTTTVEPLIASGTPAGATPTPGTATTPGSTTAKQDDVTNQFQLMSTSLQIELAGGFDATSLFLKKLQEETPRAFLITSVDISAVPDDAEDSDGGKLKNGDIKTNLSGKVFILQVPPDPKEEAKP